VKNTLKELEARLNPSRFVRVHKQAIVNIGHIMEIDHAPCGDGFAKLKCGLTLELSRRYVPLLKEKLTC
jgi:two-component system, LytTR family, response regulator